MGNDGYAVNQEGVEGLNGLATRLSQYEQEIAEHCSTIMTTVQSHADGIGPHADSIGTCVENIKSNVESASESLEELSSKVKAQAEHYQNIISNNPF